MTVDEMEKWMQQKILDQNAAELEETAERSMGKLDALFWRPDHRDGQNDNDDMILLKLELFVIHTLEGMVMEGEEKDIVAEIQVKVKAGVMEDSMTKIDGRTQG